METLSLIEDQLPIVKVNATVVFSILNIYTRRTSRESRVIGTLLGYINNNVITVSECFAIPFEEKEEDSTVKIVQDYHKTMLSFHRRNNKKEILVGWFSTSTANGNYINDYSSLINDFYSKEVANPIHIVVDTTLMADNVNVRGFVTKQLVLSDNVLANTFQEIAVAVDLSESEVTCLQHMIRGQKKGDEWSRSDVISSISSKTESVNSSMEKLLQVLDEAQSFVDKVVTGEEPPVREIGIALADALNKFSSANLTTNSSIQNKVQDLLMVSYISSLAQTQTLISEKLNQIL